MLKNIYILPNYKIFIRFGKRRVKIILSLILYEELQLNSASIYVTFPVKSTCPFN